MSKYPPRTIHLSSKYADTNYDTMNPQSGKCSFQLNKPIYVPQEYEIHLSVISANIPYSFYGIPNPIIIRMIQNSSDIIYATIPAGNWSANDIAGFLTASSITCTFVPQTGKFTFANSGLVINTFPSITGNSSSSTIVLATLGLLTAKSISASSSLISDCTPDIFGTRYVNILSTLATESITAGTTTVSSGVLASIPINTSPGNFINFMPNNLVRNTLKESSITNFDITLCDSNMVPLLLNNVSWEMDILVEVFIPFGINQTYNEAPSGDLFSSVRNYNPLRLI